MSVCDPSQETFTRTGHRGTQTNKPRHNSFGPFGHTTFGSGGEGADLSPAACRHASPFTPGEWRATFVLLDPPPGRTCRMGTGTAHRELPLARSLLLVAAGGIITLGLQPLFGAPPRGAEASAASSIDAALCAAQAKRIATLESLAVQLEQQLAVAMRARVAPAGTQLAIAAAGAGTLAAAAASPPAPPRQRWIWSTLVMNALRPFERLAGGITLRGLRLAEQKCKISTWCHRAQVINGRLYVTDLRSIFFDRHYAMARIMPLLLTMKRFKVPDLDAVFSGTDYPIMELPRDAAHMQRMYGPGMPVPALFSPTANTVSLDLPWPDFSFFPPLPRPKCGKRCIHPLKTPRWQLAHPELLALGRKLRFADKIDRAVFTGNMKTSPNRRTIFNQAEHHPELLFVNEVYIKTTPPSCFAIGEPNVTNGGVLIKRCGALI